MSAPRRKLTGTEKVAACIVTLLAVCAFVSIAYVARAIVFWLHRFTMGNHGKRDGAGAWVAEREGA